MTINVLKTLVILAGAFLLLIARGLTIFKTFDRKSKSSWDSFQKRFTGKRNALVTSKNEK